MYGSSKGKRLVYEGDWKLSYYKATERLLSDYTAVKGYIELWEKSLNELEYSGIPAMGYNEKTGKTYKISDPVHNEFIQMEKQRESIEKIIGKNKSVITQIDFALEQLNDEQRNIIQLFYFEKLQWWQIGARLHSSERTCRYKRNNAVNEMSKIIFGNFATSLPHLGKKVWYYFNN